MTECDRSEEEEEEEEEEELEQLEGLEEIDVTDWAEDDELLKRRFEEKVCHFPVLHCKKDYI
jgi:hypothetical protein